MNRPWSTVFEKRSGFEPWTLHRRPDGRPLCYTPHHPARSVHGVKFFGGFRCSWLTTLYCKALCDAEFRQTEGNGWKLPHIELKVYLYTWPAPERFPWLEMSSYIIYLCTWPTPERFPWLKMSSYIIYLCTWPTPECFPWLKMSSLLLVIHLLPLQVVVLLLTHLFNRYKESGIITYCFSVYISGVDSVGSGSFCRCTLGGAGGVPSS